MKNFKLIILLFIGVFFNSCSNDEQVYEGPANLHFNEGVARLEKVTLGSIYKDVDIIYGTMNLTQGAHSVKLVVDAAKSTAKEGVDFEILKGTDDVATGDVKGDFKIRLLEKGASLTAKKVVFKLQSSTITNAVYNQEYTLSISLECPYNLSIFNGNYTVVEDSWADYAAGDKVPVKPGPNADEIQILATNNTYISNPTTAKLILKVAQDGTFTIKSSENFSYIGWIAIPVTGSGKVDFCTGQITMSPINFGTYTNNKFVIKK